MIAKRRQPFDEWGTTRDVWRGLLFALLIVAAVGFSIWIGLQAADFFSQDHSVYRQP